MAFNKIHLHTRALAVILLTLSFSTIISMQTFAADGNTGKTYKLLEPLPCISYSPSPGSATPSPCPATTNGTVSMISEVNLGDFFQYAFNLLIAIAAVAAVTMMVYGGFLYMTTDSWSQHKKGKEYFVNAIYGLLMVLGAFLLLRTISPRLVNITTSIEALKYTAEQKQSYASYFDQLNSNASEAIAQGQQSVDQAKEAKNKLTQLEKERETLTDSVEIAKKDEAIKAAKAAIEVNQAEGLMKNGIGTTLSDINTKQNLTGNISADSIDKEIQSGKDYIDKTKDVRSNELVKIQAYNQITEADGVIDKANASKLELELLGIDTIIGKAELLVTIGLLGKTTTVIVGSQDMGSISKFKSNMTSRIDQVSNKLYTIQDSGLKQNLQNKITSIRSNLDAKFK